MQNDGGPFRMHAGAPGGCRGHACRRKDRGAGAMILWCTRCREFRKKNTPDWHECRYSSRHTLVPGHERMEKEMRQAKEKISASDKPKDEDLKRLGALEAVKNAESDSDDERGHIAAVADGMIAGHAYVGARPRRGVLLGAKRRLVGSVPARRRRGGGSDPGRVLSKVRRGGAGLLHGNGAGRAPAARQV